VYPAAGGTYVERVIVMIVVTIVFWLQVIAHQVLRLTRADGTLWRRASGLPCSASSSSGRGE
jgi:predicted metal-dependent hydrolase